MEKIYEDGVNPFVVYKADEGKPYPIIASGMTELGINIAYVKSDGTLDERPSFLLVMRDLNQRRYYTEISLRTIKPMIDAAIKYDKEIDNKLGKDH